jgi:hypothetical protein
MYTFLRYDVSKRGCFAGACLSGVNRDQCRLTDACPESRWFFQQENFLTSYKIQQA